MSMESLLALKDRYKDNGKPNFGAAVLNIVIDEIKVNHDKIDELDGKIDALEARVEALEA